MNRIDNLYEKIISLDNLILAEKKARKGKSKQLGVIEFDKAPMENLNNLHQMLINNEFKTSEYYKFTIKDPKEREIFRLPYFPDRILHHAILNILEPIFVSTFTADTYSCIKGRGIHRGLKKVECALKDKENTKYVLKFDIVKFYPSIKNEILKKLLRKKFKDVRLLKLLDEIIDSTEGQPIGNYTSQYFANFYLCYFDHYIKEVLKVKYYMRYCDDCVLMGNSKKFLWEIFYKIKEYLEVNLSLKIKKGYRVYPIKLGIDFLGYKIYPERTAIRKRTKKRFIKMIRINKNQKSIASYGGWLCHGNCKNLLKKYLK